MNAKELHSAIGYLDNDDAEVMICREGDNPLDGAPIANVYSIYKKQSGENDKCLIVIVEKRDNNAPDGDVQESQV